METTVKKHVLIAYATKYGATKEIAEKMAGILEEELSVSLAPASEVKSIQSYDAVIIGSSVYHDNWLHDAEELLESFQDQLASKDVWLFSDGISAEIQGQHKIDNWLPDALKTLAEHINLKQATLFAGKVDANLMNTDDWLVNPDLRDLSEDYRDWNTIETWTRAISQELLAAQKATA